MVLDSSGWFLSGIYSGSPGNKQPVSANRSVDPTCADVTYRFILSNFIKLAGSPS